MKMRSAALTPSAAAGLYCEVIRRGLVPPHSPDAAGERRPWQDAAVGVDDADYIIDSFKRASARRFAIFATFSAISRYQLFRRIGAYRLRPLKRQWHHSPQAR